MSSDPVEWTEGTISLAGYEDYEDYGRRLTAQLQAIVDDRDRYRAALEQIMRLGRGAHVEIARDALNPKETE